MLPIRLGEAEMALLTVQLCLPEAVEMGVGQPQGFRNYFQPFCNLPLSQVRLSQEG